MPGSVKAASMLWIVFGGLGALGQLLQLISDGFRLTNIVSIAIAVAFILAGIQTRMGKAKDTLGNGIGSIVLGGLGLALILIAAMVLGPHLVALLGVLNSAGLIVAGILALVGRSGYKDWRAQTII